MATIKTRGVTFSNQHIYKTNSILQPVATGVDPSDIEVFVEHHKGRDPMVDTTSIPTVDMALIPLLSYLILQAKPSTHRMCAPGSFIPHIRT
jgi:hypothetical protein